MTTERLQDGRRTISVSQNVFRVKEANRIVLMDAARGVYHGLNGLGSSIWERLEGGRCSEEDLVSHVCREAGMDTETVSSDVATFVRKLRAEGLIQGETRRA